MYTNALRRRRAPVRDPEVVLREGAIAAIIAANSPSLDLTRVNLPFEPARIPVDQRQFLPFDPSDFGPGYWARHRS